MNESVRAVAVDVIYHLKRQLASGRKPLQAYPQHFNSRFQAIKTEVTMFGHNSVDKEAGHRLLGQDQVDHDDSTVWDHQTPATTGRDTPIDSEIWDQDPLNEQSHELKDVHASTASRGGRPRRRPRPEDHGEAATDLAEEFERIYNPMKREQEEKARFHDEVDAACAAYSSRLEEMQDSQREREAAIEKPWLLARRRREGQRALAVLNRLGTIATCYWGGTVAHLPEVPPEVPWPPPHLSRMRDHHAGERSALRDAHLAVVDELRVKHKCEVNDEGLPIKEQHVCVERALLLEVIGDGPVPTNDITE